MSWSHYLLQVNIYLSVFYCFYRLLLAKETYFVLNRIYLVGAGFCSLIIPFMQIEWFSKQQISQQIYVQVSEINQIIIDPNTVALPSAPQFNWGALVGAIYLIGVSFYLLRFVFRLVAVKQMLNGIKSGLAFSFWKQKVVAPNLPEVATVNHHEDIHIKQLHTADIIFFEILGIITWFNPIIYLYKEAIKSIHEYLADEAAATFQGDKEIYAMLLLNQAFGVNTNNLTNGFFKKSMIKKRIFMLYKERSKKTAILKYGIFLPLFASALLLSSATISKNQEILALADEVKLAEVKEVLAEKVKPIEKIVEVQLAPKLTVSSNDDYKSFYKFLGDNIKYSKQAQAIDLQGNSIVMFTVGDKKITSININPKLGYGTDEEITKVLRQFNAAIFSDGKYCMRIEHRLNGASTTILNDNASLPSDYKALQTLTIMGYSVASPTDKIYSFVSLENPPTYPGGIDKFYAFLGQTIVYPDAAKEANIQGNVFVSFVVQKDGSLSDIKIDRKLGYGTDEEAVRVLNLSKRWNPGLINGKPVNVKYNLPIKFALNKNVNVSISPSSSTQSDKTIYSFVSMENPPSYPGGMAAFYKHLSDNIKYPSEAAKAKIQGNVFLSFIVNEDGSLSDIKVDRSLGYGTDEEAVRVLKMSEKWNPGLLNGKPVKVKYNIPIKFSIRK